MRGFLPPAEAKPRLIAHLFTLSADLARRRRGIAAVTALGLVAGSLARHKTCSAMIYVEAARRARAAGADEALLGDGAGGIAEGSAANLFAVIEGRLVTPAGKLPLLPGLTRAWVMGHARVTERAILLPDLLEAEESFLTSSLLGIAPLVSVDGHRISSGRAGRVTRRLQGTLRAEWKRGTHRCGSP